MKKNILCIGGSGCLGSSFISQLVHENCINVDYKPNNMAKNNLILNKSLGIIRNNQIIIQTLQKYKLKLDSIIVTTGSRPLLGSIQDVDYMNKYQNCQNSFFKPCLLAYEIQKRNLMNYSQDKNKKTSIILFGAADVFIEPQSERFFYSLVKMQTHSLAIIMAKQNEITKAPCSVITILPQNIDTTQNKKHFPLSFTKNWLKPNQITSVIKKWIQNSVNQMPINGSFVYFRSKKGQVVYNLV